MNKEKASLKENLDEILKNLPAEMHDDFKKQVDEMDDAAPAAPSAEDQVAAIKAELVANPAGDESAAEIGEVKAPEAVAPLSEAEVEKEMAGSLEEAKAQAAKSE